MQKMFTTLKDKISKACMTFPNSVSIIERCANNFYQATSAYVRNVFQNAGYRPSSLVFV